VADAAAELYKLPLDDFTRARNELAAKLKKDKRGADAEENRKLPKPSITAWALDQVASGSPKLVERLLETGEALGKAQRALLAGKDPKAFREATNEQRRAIGAVVEAAAKVLEEHGHPVNKTTADRLDATLRAAAADPEEGELLRRGVLARDLDPSGFGGLEAALGASLGAAPIPFPERRASREPAPAAPPASDEGRAGRLQEGREAVAGLKRRLQELRQRSAEAESEAAAARQAAHKADQAVRTAERALAEAREAAEKAHDKQAEAAEELDQLRGQIDETADALAKAEEELEQLRR